MSLATRLSDAIAGALATADMPPEIADFVLSVIVSGAAVSLVGMKKANENITTVLEVMDDIDAVVQGVHDRLPAEMKRLRDGAVEAAKMEVSGSC